MKYADWLKNGNKEGFIFTKNIYNCEWLIVKEKMFVEVVNVWNMYQYMISPYHEPEESWAMLHSYHKEAFLQVFNYCKEKELKNMRKYWGRRFNMMYNIPKSFETYSGRIYEITL